MKLRNKQTGEILDDAQYRNYSLSNGFGFRMNGKEWEYHSLAELNEEWEDAPEEPVRHWFISGTRVYEENGYSDEGIASLESVGNHFKSKEEAEKVVEKLKAWKRLKDKGFKFKGWKNDTQTINYNFGGIAWPTKELKPDLDLLFGGEE